MLFKIFLITFAFFALYRAKKQYDKKQISRYWVMIWSALWIVIIGVALMPQATDAMAAFVGVGRGADLLLYTSVMFLLYATYRTMVKQQKMSEEITELVRRIAIDNPKQQ